MYAPDPSAAPPLHPASSCQMRSLSVLQLLSPKPTELPSTTSPQPSQPSQHRIVGKGKHVPCQAGSEQSRGGHAGYEGVPPVILSPGGSGTVERPPEIVFPFYAGAATGPVEFEVPMSAKQMVCEGGGQKPKTRRGGLDGRLDEDHPAPGLQVAGGRQKQPAEKPAPAARSGEDSRNAPGPETPGRRIRYPENQKHQPPSPCNWLDCSYEYSYSTVQYEP